MQAALVFVGRQWMWVLEIQNGQWVYVPRIVNVWQPVNVNR